MIVSTLPLSSDKVCKFLNQFEECESTTHLFIPTPETCRACMKTQRGPGINEVTVLKSIEALQQEGLAVPDYLLKAAGPSPVLLTRGPGTTLSSFLSWFVTKPPNCACDDRAALMNLWGKKECMKQLPTILSWLRESAF